MASTAPVRVMPKHLKATYLADQEYLLEETRGTKLYYFPGPILWTLIFGLITLAAAGGIYGGLPSWSISGYFNLSHWSVSSSLSMDIVLFWFVLFLVGLVFLLARYLRWIATVYAVSSRRVIVQKGIFGRDFDEIPVTQVRGVDVHQSLLQRILGYGTVRVSSEGGSRLGNEDWKGIPKPFRFQKHIEDATQNLSNPNYPPAPPAAAPPR